MNRIIEYFKASKAELMKVVWPSRAQTRDHTMMVIVISVGIALFLGAIDYLLEQAVRYFIIR